MRAKRPRPEQCMVLVLQALAFAARNHRDQRRKDPSASPYINHPIALANVLMNEASVRDPKVICAALLHDTVEDTETTMDELAREFGAEVASLVAEVTDDKSLPKAERKQLQVKNAPHKSPRAKLIKVADKTSNLRSIVSSPPADWSLQRKRDYFDWAAKVVAGCRGINTRLEDQFDEAYAAGLAGLGSS